jgi:hypothetical protein
MSKINEVTASRNSNSRGTVSSYVVDMHECNKLGLLTEFVVACLHTRCLLRCYHMVGSTARLIEVPVQRYNFNWSLVSKRLEW